MKTAKRPLSETRALLEILKLRDKQVAEGKTKAAQPVINSLGAKNRDWLRKNREAIEAYNGFVEANGVHKATE